jgi:hypothetical protein
VPSTFTMCPQPDCQRCDPATGMCNPPMCPPPPVDPTSPPTL